MYANTYEFKIRNETIFFNIINDTTLPIKNIN